MGKAWGVAVMTVALGLTPVPGRGQSDAQCSPEERAVGSIGLTGIHCERCTFTTSDRGERASFFTEPTVLSVRDDAPAANLLREGDVIVAIDGELITTRRGWEAFNDLPPEGVVELRVRRDGRLQEIPVPLKRVCAARRATEVAPEAPASPPLPPTPALEDLAPDATLGFGFQCSDCSFDGEAWRFTGPLEVRGVSRRGVGMRAGDRIVAIDGVGITSEEGGRRFAGIQAGDEVRWSIDREGGRVEVTTVAGERASVAPEPPAGERPRATGIGAPRAAAEGPLRFAGAVGNVTVEVRGGRVTVTETDDGQVILIRSGDVEVRIVAPGGRR